MFAKIFNQIFDSSIVDEPQTRFTFMDFLILADKNGVVDMTHESIARRTNRPIEVIRNTITQLEGPDPRSRTPDENGARIYRLDEHRDWGWGIVNYQYYRNIASQEQRREKTRLRVQKHRKAKNPCNEKSLPVTLCNAPLRSCNDSPSASASAYMEDLKRNPLHALIDIDKELEKARQWCQKKNRKFTQRFFNNWLKNADRAIPATTPKPKPASPAGQGTTEEQRKQILEAARSDVAKLSKQFKMP